MTVEIIGAEIKDGDVTLTCIDCSEEHLQYLERTRDDRETEVEFKFYGTDRKAVRYLYSWLKDQKAARSASTWGEAVHSVVGTITTICNRYRVWE